MFKTIIFLTINLFLLFQCAFCVQIKKSLISNYNKDGKKKTISFKLKQKFKYLEFD